MALRVCATPGCPELTSKTRCDEHRREKKRKDSAGRSATPQQRFYKTPAWRRARAEFLRTHPVCEDESGCIKPVEHVHHIDSDPLGPRGLDQSNLQGLCHSHHSRKTAMATPGWGLPK